MHCLMSSHTVACCHVGHKCVGLSAAHIEAIRMCCRSANCFSTVYYGLCTGCAVWYVLELSCVLTCYGVCKCTLGSSRPSLVEGFLASKLSRYWSRLWRAGDVGSACVKMMMVSGYDTSLSDWLSCTCAS